jgi:hypothetical protein
MIEAGQTIENSVTGERIIFRKTSRETNGAAVVIERFVQPNELRRRRARALAENGKTNRMGMPNPLRLAVIANAHFDTVRLPFPPAPGSGSRRRSAHRSDGSRATSRSTGEHAREAPDRALDPGCTHARGERHAPPRHRCQTPTRCLTPCDPRGA